jgi:methyl-accepting chemotaxis protein
MGFPGNVFIDTPLPLFSGGKQREGEQHVRLTIKIRLLGLAFAGVAVALAIGGVGLFTLERGNAARRDLHNASAALRNHTLGDMMHDALHADVLGALVARSKEERDAVASETKEHCEDFRGYLKSNQELPLDPQLHAALMNLKPELETYLGDAQSMVDAALQDPVAARAKLPAFVASFHVLEVDQDKLAEQIEAYNAKAVANAEREARFAFQLICLIALLGAAAVVGLAWVVTRSIVRPIEATSKTMADIADGEGDLTRRLPATSRDEVGDLERAFNRFAIRMHDLIVQVRDSAAGVATASQELTSVSDTISASAQEQAASLEQTAASLEEITATVKQNAENAKQASQLASAARDVAEKGGTVVANAVDAMGAINGSSRRIADITTTIDEIAFQTNLLALNAAVEAARAGEQGRGFAVVAAEVRSLAQRSAQAAKEIKGLIEDSVHNVDDGTRLVNQSGATLEEIVTAVKRVTDIVAEIAAASREQSTGVEEVNKAVTQMDHATQSNAAQTEELSATAGQLADQSRDVFASVQRFKLADSGNSAPRIAPAPATPAPAPRARITPIPAKAHRVRPVAIAANGSPDGFEEF